MNCSDERPGLKGKSDKFVIQHLAKERNRIGQSRDKWIQAAFNLRANDSTLFDQLVAEELCKNCVKTYTSNASKNN